MIPRTLEWIREVNDCFDLDPKSILEIGSIDTNGSPRSFFSGDYLGIDIQKGKGVDLVLSGYLIADYFSEGLFDAVLCLHLLEHVAKPWEIIENVYHVLRSGGLFYVSIPTFGFPKHDYPKDYWRLSEEAVREVIMKDYAILDLEHGQTKYGKHPIINCLGMKL
jgi:predicted SAM-dependent methyltransferase